LAFFGTAGDVGSEAELEALKSCIKKQSNLKTKVTISLIKNADHMYEGEEGQVSETITVWMNTILRSGVH
jgi:hypothetical protein